MDLGQTKEEMEENSSAGDKYFLNASMREDIVTEVKL